MILAGGAGERFWPASRAALPKPFLRVLGERTLLDATAARAQRIATRARVWVVCGAEHERPIRAAMRLPRARVLVEPERRNTAAAVAFAALRIAAEDPDAVMLVLPADHFIPDVRAFARSRAQRRARGRTARACSSRSASRRRAPTPATATSSAARRRARPTRVCSACGDSWRSPTSCARGATCAAGTFSGTPGSSCGRRATILAEIARYMPELDAAFAPLARAPARRRAAAVARAYRRAPSAPIDTGRDGAQPPRLDAARCPGTGATSAPGNRSRRSSVSRRAQSRVVAGSELAFDDRGGNLVWGQPGRPVALLGVEG